MTDYTVPAQGFIRRLSLPAFADAGRSESSSPLCFITDIFIGPIKQRSIFHLLSWSFHNSRLPARSTAAAEILAAGEALEDVVILKSLLSLFTALRCPLLRWLILKICTTH